MPWIELCITTSESHVDSLSEQLTEFGALAVTYQDAGDQPIFEPQPDTKLLWQQTTITSLFDSEHPIKPILDFLKTQQNLGILSEIKQTYLADEDWERRCLDSFKPMQFGKRLWVCPSWHSIPDPNAVNLILDPGLAFGTGSHPTTALCLEWLEQQVKPNDIVIDYGCGSGILAIAALKLGASQAIAIDNDPQALAATQANAKRNQISATQLIIAPPGEPVSTQADILIANILAQPLIGLAPVFASFLTKKGAKIAISGILSTQATEVINAYAPWFVMQPPVTRNEWVRLEGIRKFSI